MAMGKPLSRRKRLIIKYTLIGSLLVFAAWGSLSLLRERPKPYSPGEKIEGITSELERGIPPDYPRVRFTNVAAEAGISFQHFQATRTTQLPEDMGSGAAWGDYDNDGDLDLYVCDIAGPVTASPDEIVTSPGGNRLFRNDGNGSFTDVTAVAGVGYKGVSMGAGWADFDNDGDLDLAVTNYGPLLLYRNRGDGSFEDVSRAAALDKYRGFWAGASWADYDHDGYADLYVCGYVKYVFQPEFVGRSSKQYDEAIPFMINPSSYKPERNLLLHNNGDGTFREVARRAGVENRTGRSLSAVWADFDGDDWSDLYVANDISDNAMFRNLRDGRFEDISHSAWVSDYRGAMGLAVADYDRDGDLDIFVTHWLAQENAFYWNLRFSHEGGSNPAPFRCTDVADMLGLGQISLQNIGWGTSFFDYDNDGRPDLFAVNGSTFQEEEDPRRLVRMKNQLYWQKSPEDGFFEVGAVSGAVFQELHVGRGAAFADYDNDGDVDVVVVNHGEPAMLLRNDGGNNNNWLKVRLRPSKSNRSGFGARVEVQTQAHTQFQEVGSQSSYLSQNALEAHFGLGRAATAERLTVRFPSGVVREMEKLPVNQTVVVKE